MTSRLLGRLLLVTLGFLFLFHEFNDEVAGYATVGYTWAANQVVYYVNPNNASSISPAAVIQDIQNAAIGWTAQTHANIQLVYGGTTNGSSLAMNSKNEVFFRNDVSSFGAETYWYYDYTGHLVDADIVFHEGSSRFFPGTSGCSGGIYLGDIAIHEFGHMLGLAHSSVAGATMEPYLPSFCDLTQLSLEADDISGIESLYPPTGKVTNTAPTVSIASPGDGSSFASGTVISFSGSASDTKDGNLTSSLTWTSSLDGTIGHGGSFTRSLSSGTHTITAAVTDTGGLIGSRQVTVTVAASSGGGTSTVSPDGTTVPSTASQIVDSSGAIWTLGANYAILRNGSQTGSGSQILWKSSTIYALGTDNTWWQWIGTGWTKAGATTPGGGTSNGSQPSPDGTTVPTTASQIVDSSGAIWTLGANYAILRNGSQTGSGSQILWKSSTIYALGTDNTWWQWIGTGWTKAGATTPGGGTSNGSQPSPDGTTVPTNASQIVDSSGAIWTIGANYAILRNGSQTGSGSQILWKSSTIYALGTDNTWWQWIGTGWTKVGATTPGGGTSNGSQPSPDGTTVPTNASQIVDSSGAIWTIGANYAILRNGSQTGSGSQILWKDSTIYALGTDNTWWQWIGTGWTKVGATTPGGGGQPDGTTVPSTASQIVDSSGAIWTIGANYAILRNSSQTGSGSQILWKNSTIYAFGTDSNWWRWTGSGWIYIGPLQP